MPVSLFDDLGIEEELGTTLKDEDVREDPAVPVRLLPVVPEPDPLPLAHSPGERGGLLAEVLDRFVRVLCLRGVDTDESYLQTVVEGDRIAVDNAVDPEEVLGVGEGED